MAKDMAARMKKHTAVCRVRSSPPKYRAMMCEAASRTHK